MLPIRSYCITVLFLILSLTCHAINTTDDDDIRDEKHKFMRYLSVILFTTLTLYGIIINTLLVIVLLSSKEDHQYSHPFILIATQLIVCNFLSFLPQIFVVIPKLLQSINSPYGWLIFTVFFLNYFF